MYIQKVSLTLILLAAILGSSCKKNQWKEPTSVGFSFSLSPKQGGPGTFNFEEGHIQLQRFWVEGKREQAEDIFFERTYTVDNALQLPFNTFLPSEELSFDIPQGTYTSLKIGYETISSTDKCIRAEGLYEYNNPNKDPIWVEFLADNEDIYEIILEDNSGSNTINLIADQAVHIDIILDPKHWFKNVTGNAMSSAAVSNGNNGQDKIQISKNQNDNIYNVVISRVGKNMSNNLN